MPSRLPPRVSTSRTSQSTRQKPAAAWYHHLTWTGALAACVVFVVLIAGAFGVRQILIVSRDEPEGRENAGEQLEVSESAEPAVKHSPPEPLIEETAAVTAPLPAAADKTVGRSIPTELVVGSGAEMFPTLAEAWKVAIAGDVIVLHTNAPQIIAETLFAPGGEAGDDPLVLRAAEGFEPIIVGREGSLESLFLTKEINLQFERLHFVLPSLQAIRTMNADITVRYCTFTTMDAPRYDAREAVGVWEDEESPIVSSPEIVFEHCLFRGVNPFSNSGAETFYPTVRLEKCAGVVGGAAMSGHPFRMEVDRSTLVCGQIVLATTVPLDSQPADGYRFQVRESLIVPVIGPTGRTLLVELRFDVPPETTLETLEPFERLRHQVAAVEMSTNIFGSSKPVWAAIMSYRDGGSSDSLWGTFRNPVMGPLPTFDQTLELGPRIKAFQTAPNDQKNAIAASVMPADFQVRQSDTWLRLARSGTVYGCPINELPTPPAAISSMIH